MIFKKFLVLWFMLAGCAHYPELTSTPKYRIPVHVRADVPVDESTLLAWVDLRADEWIAHRADWGVGGMSGEELGAYLRAEPVIVYAGYYLEDGNIGYNFWGSTSPQIHVTVNDPPLRGYFPYDPAYLKIVDESYLYGLRQLPHEWTHTVRGAWHP